MYLHKGLNFVFEFIVTKHLPKHVSFVVHVTLMEYISHRNNRNDNLHKGHDPMWNSIKITENLPKRVSFEKWKCIIMTSNFGSKF